MRSTSLLYDTASGRILQNHLNSRAVLEAFAIPPGQAWIHGKNASPVTSYVQGGSIIPRPAMAASLDKTTITANGVDQAIISNLPNPTEVYVTGPGSMQMTVIDGTAEITADTPGTYSVRCEAFPYLDYEVQIVAA